MVDFAMKQVRTLAYSVSGSVVAEECKDKNKMTWVLR